jgi:cell division protein FtsQ
MTTIISVSSEQLKDRRKQLRRKKRVFFWQGLWRFCLITAITGGLTWVITRPNWIIYESEQIEIEGNQFLSKDAIRSLLPLKYPQSLLRIEPKQLVAQLESTGPIADAVISRQVFPPSLTITVKERKPVAIAPSPFAQESGFLDAQGIWMPQSSYTQIKEKLDLPKLKVLGFQEDFKKHWQTLYPLIKSSPVKISLVDWRNPSNLILVTELGKVHCGGTDAYLTKQLTVLAKMRNLSNHVSIKAIEYIDLTNPQYPTIQLVGNPKNSSFDQDPSSTQIAQRF